MTTISFSQYKYLTEQVNFINDFHTLGVPRAQMPQIKSFKVSDFEAYLVAQGFTLKNEKLEVGKLKLTQVDINMNKVISMVQNIRNVKQKPVIISSDSYILDGHHRIFALQIAHPKEKVPVHRVSMKIRELLRFAHDWDGSTTEA